MTEIELDFLRQCLIIDGEKRPSVTELLDHPYFTKEFKQNFEDIFNTKNQADFDLK